MRATTEGSQGAATSEFDCVLSHADDLDREVQLTVMVMDVPSQKATRRSKETPTT